MVPRSAHPTRRKRFTGTSGQSAEKLSTLQQEIEREFVNDDAQSESDPFAAERFMPGRGTQEVRSEANLQLREQRDLLNSARSNQERLALETRHLLMTNRELRTTMTTSIRNIMQR